MTVERFPSEAGILALARQDLLAMPGYEPIEPVEIVAARLGVPEAEILKLDGNENAYGPSPRVTEALGRYAYYHIYPDPDQRELREAIGRHLSTDPSRIVVGAGADELLDLVARLFLLPGDVVVTAPPTFGMYAFEALLLDATLTPVPRREDFGLDMPALEATLAKGAKVLYLASPNNPTGNCMSKEDLERLLAYPTVVVVDEAYAEFSDQNFIPLVPQHQNLIVVRTFSKWAGLAGLRIGYGVFPTRLAKVLQKIKMPYNVSVAAYVGARASLADVDLLRERVQAIVAERDRLCRLLSEFNWLKPFPSEANFVLCNLRGKVAKSVQAALRQRGILVRYFDLPAVSNCLRITVGRPEQTDRLIAVLKEIGDGD